MDDELDPRLVAALRDVPSAADGVRDAHIANAVAVADGSATFVYRRFPNRRGWLSSAAAAVVLLAVGTAVGRSTVDRSPTEPAPGTPTTTMPPKTGVGNCRFGEGSWGDVGWTRSVVIDDVPYVFVGRFDAIDILRDDSACTRVTSVDTPPK